MSDSVSMLAAGLTISWLGLVVTRMLKRERAALMWLPSRRPAPRNAVALASL